jgi:hypothetical protein
MTLPPTITCPTIRIWVITASTSVTWRTRLTLPDVDINSSSEATDMDSLIMREKEDPMDAITPHTMTGILVSQTWRTVTNRPTISAPPACSLMKAYHPRTELVEPTVAAVLAARTLDRSVELREVGQVETATATKTLVVMGNMRTGPRWARIATLLACHLLYPGTIRQHLALREATTGVPVMLIDLSVTGVTGTMVPAAPAAVVATATVDTLRISLGELPEPAAQLSDVSCLAVAVGRTVACTAGAVLAALRFTDLMAEISTMDLSLEMVAIILDTDNDMRRVFGGGMTSDSHTPTTLNSRTAACRMSFRVGSRPRTLTPI